MIKLKSKKHLRGSTMLISVLIISVIGVVILLAILVSVAKTSDTSQVGMEYNRAHSAATACAEVTLTSLNLDTAHPAGEIINFLASSCEVIAITGTGNNNRVIQIQGYSGPVTARIAVDVQELQPQIVLNSWQEVADF